MTTIAIIGAGNIGSQLARATIAAGYDVVIANSRGPETLAELVSELGPRARAATVKEAAQAGDFAVVAVILNSIESIPAAPFAGKIVLDTNNYYFERGHIEVLDRKEQTTSGLVQAHFADSKVVKAFNAINAKEITTTGSLAGTPNRRALATASDFEDAIELVTRLYDELGFDTVNVGPLSESWRIERDTPGYTKIMTREQLLDALATAER
jgi:predicted dinucleotide-binding enzyme